MLRDGIACCVLEWRHKLSALATTHRVFALDLPGHGLTNQPADFPCDIEGITRFVLAFMEAQGLEKVHLTGNSLGRRLALECAQVAPQRLRSMMLSIRRTWP